MGLLDSRAFNGDVTRDPFCFQKFELTSIKQIVRGEEYPYETLQLVQDSGARQTRLLSFSASQWSLVEKERQHGRNGGLGKW